MGGLLDYQGIYAVFEPWILSFGLALVRIGTLFITTPVFSMSMIPNTIKAAMVALLTLVAMSNVQPIPYITQLNAIEIGGAILTEACVGGVMGISVMFLFGALAMAGQLIGIQMGFAIANVVDPTTNQQNGVLAQLLNLMGLVSFHRSGWALVHVAGSLSELLHCSSRRCYAPGGQLNDGTDHSGVSIVFHWTAYRSAGGLCRFVGECWSGHAGSYGASSEHFCRWLHDYDQLRPTHPRYCISIDCVGLQKPNADDNPGCGAHVALLLDWQ